MDAGARLLELIDRRVAKGEDRHAAKASVFAANRDLVAEWHHGAAGEPREEGMATYPGDVLLRLVNGYVGLGMNRSAAEHRVWREHPHVARAHHLGIEIQKPRPRLPGSSGMRRLVSSDERLRPGEVLLHKLADPSAGGGWFAVAGI